MNICPHIVPDGANLTNTSTTLSEYEDEFAIDPATVYFLSGFLAIICVVSLFGNTLILYTFLHEKPLRPPLRIILCNLAVANLLIAGIGEPMVIISGFHLRWVFDEVGRSMEAYTATAGGLVSMNLLAFLAIERYLSVTPGQTFQISKRIAARLCALMWIYNVVYASMPFYGIADWRGEGIGISNSISWNTEDKADFVYVMVMMSTGYFIPLIIITFCYCRILRVMKETMDILEAEEKLKKHKTQQLEITIETTLSTSYNTSAANTSAANTSAANTTNNESFLLNVGVDEPSVLSPVQLQISTDTDPGNDPKNKAKVAEIKISNVVAIIMISFFVSWTPYLIANILVIFNKADHFSNGINATIPAMLAKTTTIWCPIISCLMQGEVRTANMRTIGRMKERIRKLYCGE